MPSSFRDLEAESPSKVAKKKARLYMRLSIGRVAVPEDCDHDQDRDLCDGVCIETGSGTGAGAGAGAEAGENPDSGATAKTEGFAQLAVMARRASLPGVLDDVGLLGASLFRHLTMCVVIGRAIVPLMRVMPASSSSAELGRCVRLKGLLKHTAEPSNTRVRSSTLFQRRSASSMEVSPVTSTSPMDIRISSTTMVQLGVVVPDTIGPVKHKFFSLSDHHEFQVCMVGEYVVFSASGTDWNIKCVMDTRRPTVPTDVDVSITGWKTIARRLCLSIVLGKTARAPSGVVSVVRGGNECFKFAPATGC
jgi:hypothetical protein